MQELMVGGDLSTALGDLSQQHALLWHNRCCWWLALVCCSHALPVKCPTMLCRGHEIACDIARGLSYLHGVGVWHLDIKSGVLVCRAAVQQGCCFCG